VRRDVAVNDVERLAVVVLQLVGGVEAEERVDDHAHGDADVDGAADGGELAAKLGQRRPLDVIHDDEGHPAVEAELAHLDDVGMIDGRSEARLVHEHGEEGLVALEMAVGSFHGDQGRT